MVIAAVVASLHYLTLALGLGSLFMRGRYLRTSLEAADRQRLFLADNAWGVAALLWIVTGALRAFARLEKGTDYYLAQPLFWTKLGLFGAVFLLELRPMITFIRWRIALRGGRTIDTAVAARLRRLNDLELVLTVAIVFVASLMARGVGG